MLNNNRITMFDECFNELTPESQTQIMELLKTIIDNLISRGLAKNGKYSTGLGIGGAKELLISLILGGHI